MLVTPPLLPRLFFRDAIWRIPSSEGCAKSVFLTFDDGPAPGVTEKVLSILQRNKIKASFFCLGKNIEKHKGLFDELSSEGHLCANHSFTHLNGWRTKNADYISDVERCSSYFSNSFFRPPYGKISPQQFQSLKKKYRIVFWDVISNDFDNRITPRQCLLNVTKHVRNGSLIVFHDSEKARKNLEFALPNTIDFLLDKGYNFSVLK